jgi:hypothetical protein
LPQQIWIAWCSASLPTAAPRDFRFALGHRLASASLCAVEFSMTTQVALCGLSIPSYGVPGLEEGVAEFILVLGLLHSAPASGASSADTRASSPPPPEAFDAGSVSAETTDWRGPPDRPLCSVTLISLMAGECRVGTEVAVANQPKVCSAAAEGLLRPISRTCTKCWCSRRESNPEPWD